MPHRFFLFLFLPVWLPAQPFIDDNIIFWDSADWDRTEILYHYPGEQAVAWAIRQYYDNDRRSIRDEFLRIDSLHWLYNAKDTAGASNFRRGPMRVDTEHPLIDSMFTFHPETYEEVLRIDTIWRLLADGYWQESDTAGFYWSGNYRNGLRHGLWRKLRILPNEVYDLRNIMYTDGQSQPEIQLNLALGGDSAAVEQALLGSWVHCRDYRQLASWQKWEGKIPQNCGTHHGTTIYWFQPDQLVQQCYPSGSSLEYRTQTGRWWVDRSMTLTLVWDGKNEMIRIPIRSLLDNELRLDDRK